MLCMSTCLSLSRYSVLQSDLARLDQLLQLVSCTALWVPGSPGVSDALLGCLWEQIVAVRGGRYTFQKAMQANRLGGGGGKAALSHY